MNDFESIEALILPVRSIDDISIGEVVLWDTVSPEFTQYGIILDVRTHETVDVLVDFVRSGRAWIPLNAQCLVPTGMRILDYPMEAIYPSNYY